MKLFSNSEQRRLHGIMLPSIAITFIASNYVIFAEIGPLLHWNLSFYWLFSLMILGFGISWVYAGAINKEYKKVKAEIDDSDQEVLQLQAKLKTLSRKERQVLNLILQGKNNQQISDELFISMSTLKSHINHIYKKLGVSTRQKIFMFLG
jgi:DNA-binding CsgD family transcriptional regulator